MPESLLVSSSVMFDALCNLGALFAVLLLAKFVYRINHPKISQATGTGNTAAAVAFGGYLCGICIAIGGLLVSISNMDNVDRVLAIAGFGSALVVMMGISLYLNDKFILSKFNNLREIYEDKNLGVAFVEFGGCLATGFMLYSVLSCQAMSLQEKVMYTGIYWAISQFLLIVGARIFEYSIKYNIQKELEANNNPAVGLLYGGSLLSIGLVLMTALNGAGTDLASEAWTIGLFYVIGIVTILLSRIIVGALICPSKDMTVENTQTMMSISLVETLGMLSIAVLFVAAVNPSNAASIFKTYENPLIISHTEEKAVHILSVTPPVTVTPVPVPAEAKPVEPNK